MRTGSVWVWVLGLALSTSDGARAQSSVAASWSLPREVAVSDHGSRAYRFTVDYQTANRQGAIVHRQRITGEYTRGLAGGEVAWRNVAQSEADGASGPCSLSSRETRSCRSSLMPVLPRARSRPPRERGAGGS